MALKVIDTETGREGRLVATSGYVLGGSYVNAGWRIVWQDADDTEEVTPCGCESIALPVRSRFRHP